MSAGLLNRPVTKEEFLAMPENGMDRYVVKGELREKPMTVRNRFHSEALSVLSCELVNWLRSQPVPRGKILSGEAGICLPTQPESIVGVDVAYISPDLAARQDDSTTLIDGIPVLIVEILSPSDTNQELHEKVKLYRSVEVQVVWLVDPGDQTVRVYEQGKKPRLVNSTDELTAEPYLPGFRVPVGRLFE